VRNHGGSIAFASTPGQGTRVLVTLPCAGALPQPPSEAAPVPGASVPAFVDAYP
jgi:hypothetical protein